MLVVSSGAVTLVVVAVAELPESVVGGLTVLVMVVTSVVVVVVATSVVVVALAPVVSVVVVFTVVVSVVAVEPPEEPALPDVVFDVLLAGAIPLGAPAHFPGEVLIFPFSTVMQTGSFVTTS